MWGAHWSILLEKAGIPGVYVVDEPFRADVEITCEKEGMAGLRRVVVPHPCGDTPDADLPSILSRMVEALTVPLTDAEKSPRKKEVKPQTEIGFQGYSRRGADVLLSQGLV